MHLFYAFFKKFHAKDANIRMFNPSIRLSGANGSRLSVKGAVRFPLSLTRRISVTTDVLSVTIFRMA